MDDVLIGSKFIPTMLAPHYSQELAGRLHLRTPVADPHPRPPYWSLLRWFSGAAPRSGGVWSEPPWPVTVATRPVLISGSEAGARSVYHLSYNFSLIASLFVSPPSFSRRSSYLCRRPHAAQSRGHCYPWHLGDKVTPDERWCTCALERAAICSDTDVPRPLRWSSRLFLRRRVWSERQRSEPSKKKKTQLRTLK